MERLWKQKLMRVQKEIKANQVGDGAMRPAHEAGLYFFSLRAIYAVAPSTQHAQCVVVHLIPGAAALPIRALRVRDREPANAFLIATAFAHFGTCPYLQYTVFWQ